MKIGKIIIGIIIVVALVVGALVVFVLNNINDIVKEVIETKGPEVTQTLVKLGNVDIKLTDGRGELNQLRIANPEGFSSPNLITAGTIALQVEPRSVAEPVIVLNEVTIDGIKVTVEQKDLTYSNIQAMLDNIKRSTKALGGGSGEADSAKSGSDTKLMIEKLTFANSSIHIMTEKWGERTIELPSFSKANIGNKTTGLTPEQVTETILKSYLTTVKRSVVKQVKALAKDEVKDKAKEKLKEKIDEKLSDDQKQKLDQLKSLFK